MGRVKALFGALDFVAEQDRGNRDVQLDVASA
jgi:hypothetical protein